MTSLTNTYAKTMAQAQGNVMTTSVYDSSAMDGRSVEGELLVELSNVSEFDGAINKFQGQIQDLSGELLNGENICRTYNALVYRIHEKNFL